MRYGVIAVASFALGCSPSGETVDASTTDAATDAVVDGGRCTGTVLTASCSYNGYGTPCPVRCTFPSGCTFDVQVTFRGNSYCCGFENGWDDCVCENGFAQCRPAFNGLPRQTPMTYCEFCNPPRVDAGMDATGPDDADVDAP